METPPRSIQFLVSNKLCFRCLSNEHVSRFYTQRKACNTANCKRKHRTILHTSPRERAAVDVGVGTENDLSTQACSIMVNMGIDANGRTLDESHRTGIIAQFA